MGWAIMVFFIAFAPLPIRFESAGLELASSLHKWLSERDFHPVQDKNVDIFVSWINIRLPLVFRNSLEVLWGGTTGRVRGRTS